MSETIEKRIEKPKVIKGSEYYKTEFEKRFQKHFPELEVSYVFYRDIWLPEDHIDHVFVRKEFVEKKILRIFKYKKKIIKKMLVIEPDTGEYPRKEIWENNEMRAIKVHIYDNSLLDRVQQFAKGYIKMFGEKVTIVEEVSENE